MTEELRIIADAVAEIQRRYVAGTMIEMVGDTLYFYDMEHDDAIRVAGMIDRESELFQEAMLSVDSGSYPRPTEDGHLRDAPYLMIRNLSHLGSRQAEAFRAGLEKGFAWFFQA